VVLSNGTLFSKKIWFNKRKHPNKHRNGHQLSTKWALTNHLPGRGLVQR